MEGDEEADDGVGVDPGFGVGVGPGDGGWDNVSVSVNSVL